MAGIRILLTADSHLGHDLPSRERVARRRRGHDFLANHRRALAEAVAGGVDLVVHGGDVFDRPMVPASLAYQAYEPLLRVAEAGVPVFVLAGNHERARLPHVHLLSHPRVHVFDRPRTYVLKVGGARVALTGFPYQRRVRSRLPEVLAASGWNEASAELRLLCMHQCVEGAKVGPGDFTFTTAADVVRHADVPPAFGAVLSGHIHRHQVLTRDLRGRALRTPVAYPGSVERTSTAEIGEPKGYVVLELGAAGAVPSWEFRPLPARPMLVRQLDADRLRGAALQGAVRALIAAAPADAVLRIRLAGAPSPADLAALSAARLRALAPPTMNVELSGAGAGFVGRGRAQETARGPVREASPGANLVLDL